MSENDIQLLAATQHAAAAALAGGIIAASGRPHSVREALELQRSVFYALFPHGGHGRYEQWAKDPDNLNKTHK